YDHREFLQVPLEVVRHRQHRTVAVADEHHLRRLVEQLGVSSGYVEAAEGAERRGPPRRGRDERECRNQPFHVSPRWAQAARWWDATIRSAYQEKEGRSPEPSSRRTQATRARRSS